MNAVPHRKHWTALRDDVRGSAAVAFALVVIPFLGLCAAIVQVAFTIWAEQNFEHSVQLAVRSVFTGQFQNETVGQTDKTQVLTKLRAKICGPTSSNTVTLFDCSSLKIDVTSSTSFGGSTPSQPINSTTGAWDTDFGTRYVCATAGSIVVITAAAKMPTFFGSLGVDLRSFADGSRLLLSTAVFRTEPYESTNNGKPACAA